VSAVARYIADKSALARLRLQSVRGSLGDLIEAGSVATCGVIEFELLWSNRSSEEFDDVYKDRNFGYEWLSTEDADWRRALSVQRELWSTGQMRTVPLPDLLIAAVAERNRVTVLHLRRRLRPHCRYHPSAHAVGCTSRKRSIELTAQRDVARLVGTFNWAS
jgi:predicted nucleic acid-binding protein